jgi:hypothetical protein
LTKQINSSQLQSSSATTTVGAGDRLQCHYEGIQQFEYAKSNVPVGTPFPNRPVAPQCSKQIQETTPQSFFFEPYSMDMNSYNSYSTTKDTNRRQSQRLLRICHFQRLFRTTARLPKPCMRPCYKKAALQRQQSGVFEYFYYYYYCILPACHDITVCTSSCSSEDSSPLPAENHCWHYSHEEESDDTITSSWRIFLFQSPGDI